MFSCPYNRDSGMWCVSLGISPKEAIYWRPEDSLITRIDCQTILDNFKEAGATVTWFDDFIWMITITFEGGQ